MSIKLDLSGSKCFSIQCKFVGKIQTDTAETHKITKQGQQTTKQPE